MFLQRSIITNKFKLFLTLSKYILSLDNLKLNLKERLFYFYRKYQINKLNRCFFESSFQLKIKSKPGLVIPGPGVEQ